MKSANKIKIILTLFSIVLLTTETRAQNPIPKGQSQVNLGIGLNRYNIPVYLGFEKGVGKDISLGVEGSIQGSGGKNDKSSVIGIFGNGNYHFNSVLSIPSDWDLYAGLNLGFYLFTNSDYNIAGRSSGVGLGAQVGGRYYFNKKTGINLELNGGNYFGGGKFGLSFRI